MGIAESFLRQVFGPAMDADPDSFISIHVLQPPGEPAEDEPKPTRKLLSRFWKGDVGIAEAAAWATKQGESGTGRDVYFASCPSRERPKTGRGGVEVIRSLPGFWIDIDVAGEGHAAKKAYPPTYDGACRVLDKVGVPPTVVIDSGHGLWGWWLLTEPVMIPEDLNLPQASALAHRWHATVQACARSLGWIVDSVFDLARIARCPGTWNHKGEPVLARIYDRPGIASGATYTLDELDRFMIAPELIQNNDGAGAPPINIDAVMLALDREPRASVIEAATANDPKFADTWNMQRTDLKDQSASAYDLALCNFAVKCGLSDQDMADLIIGFRSKHSLNADKALRRDYVQRTIAKARAMGLQQSAMHELTEPAEPPPSDAPAEDVNTWRKGILEKISKAMWGVKVLRFIQVGRENSLYYIVIATNDGPKEIKIGPLSSVQEPARFCEPITNWTRIPLPRFKRDTWDGIYRHLMQICEMQENMELHDNVTGRQYVVEYLRRASIATAKRDVADAIERCLPFVGDGHLHLYADMLRRHLRQRQDVALTIRDLTHLLRASGFVSKPVSYRPDSGKTTSRFYWRIAIDDILPDLSPVVQEKIRGEGGNRDEQGEPIHDEDGDAPI